ncbi:uncharacterized protein LOC110922960 isoform X2 [Helianthus annuus]|uniref:uncharacterized protein LOC110878499 isoform X2 n=1 Tax=Helianthus annuus TaxID=4232 RepID=UPI000B9069B2|nr:uncharacterized protein LOC110878499 isoform X2 [Helianthus annuus]XP_022022847.1 uncharacterized protein LOC110922960 isoform X2 [Helianthus annuus]
MGVLKEQVESTLRSKLSPSHIQIMDQKTWLWKKRCAQKSIDANSESENEAEYQSDEACMRTVQCGAADEACVRCSRCCCVRLFCCGVRRIQCCC